MKLIEFIFDHFQILIPIAIIVISAISTSKKNKGGTKNRPLSPQERQQQAAEEQRVREIQEEIRRKIAERTGAAPARTQQPVQRSRSQPLQQSRSREPQRSSQGHKEYGKPRESRQMNSPRSSQLGHKSMAEHDSPHGIPTPEQHRHVEDSWAAKVAEQERLVQEQLQQAKRLEGRLKRGGRGAPTAQIGGAFPGAGKSLKASFSGVQAEMLKDLRSNHGQRKAILLREVLGEPVGMRKPGGSML